MGRASLYDWIVYKRESKARERKGEEEQCRLKQGCFYTVLQLYNYKVLLSSASQVLPFSTSAITLPPPLVKPALRLYISVLHLQGVLILIFFQQLIVFAILALYLFVQVLQGSQFIRVIAIKFLKLIGTTNKVLYRVLGRIQVIAFLTNTVLQRFPYQLIGQYFFNFLFIVAINLNQQGGLILLSR